MIEFSRESCDEQVATGLAAELALDRPPPRALVHVALTCGMWEV